MAGCLPEIVECIAGGGATRSGGNVQGFEAVQLAIGIRIFN